MSVEDAIIWLEKAIQEFERMIDEHSLLTDEEGYKELREGNKMRKFILGLLKNHPDNQPNEPLTADELKKMVGQLVYYPDAEEWKVVDKFAIQAVFCDGAKLYRRPPKEESA